MYKTRYSLKCVGRASIGAPPARLGSIPPTRRGNPHEHRIYLQVKLERIRVYTKKKKSKSQRIPPGGCCRYFVSLLLSFRSLFWFPFNFKHWFLTDLISVEVESLLGIWRETYDDFSRSKYGRLLVSYVRSPQQSSEFLQCFKSDVSQNLFL